MTAIRQIERLGYHPRDVRHIILSHLDFDHAGGLDDFPQATVHMLDIERDWAFAQKTWMDRQRFRPQQWSTSKQWRTYPCASGERWNGFDNVRQPDGLPPSILIVPLRGHTFGHAGIAVQRDDGWLLDAADAYFYRDEMNARPQCTPGLRFYQWMLEKDRQARFTNQGKLRSLALNGRSVNVFCSHDVVEFDKLDGRKASVPTPQSLPVAGKDATYTYPLR